MLRRRGERGFRVVSWDEALDRIAARRLRATAPQRLAFYLTSRGITNEVYYAAQKAARFLGTNHVDNSARLCHAASTVAMKATLGYGASTCSYADWLDADLIVLFGSNVANNQPVTTKYLHDAKRTARRSPSSTRIASRASTRYWIPSIAEQRDRRHRASPTTGSTCTPAATSRSCVGVLQALVEPRRRRRARSSTRSTTGFAEALAQRRRHDVGRASSARAA